MQMLEYAMGNNRNRSMSPYSFEAEYCFKFKRKGYEPITCHFSGRPEHIPLHPKLNLHEKMGIMVVREPKSRLISAFLDGVHTEGFTNRTEAYEMRVLLHKMDQNKSVPYYERLLTRGQIYADHRSQVGHQVKMLTGGLALDLSVKNDEVMKDLIDRAVKRMREFYFVGLFDQYARSLRLFHELANKGNTNISIIYCSYFSHSLSVQQERHRRMWSCFPGAPRTAPTRRT